MKNESPYIIVERRADVVASRHRCAVQTAGSSNPTRRTGRGFLRKNPDLILWIEAFGFGTLIAVAWLAEVVGLPYLLFEDAHTLNWLRPLLRTIVIMAVWLLVHLATRSLLKRLHYLEEFMLVCGWCRKIGHDGEWISTAEYFKSAHALQTSHGICPDCCKAFMAVDPGPGVDLTEDSGGI